MVADKNYYNYFLVLESLVFHVGAEADFVSIKDTAKMN